MNQAIHFPDREEWDEVQAEICFPALVNGIQIMCAISAKTLSRRFGGDTPDDWLAAFREHRWDLEEEAEQASMRRARRCSRLVLAILSEILVFPFDVIVSGIV